jgi:ribosomal protein L32
MTVGEKRLTYQTCPQCGQQNRAAFHCCHHCGYVFPKARKKLKLTGEDMGEIVGALLGLISGLLLWDELRLLGAILFFFGVANGGA